MPYGGEIQLQQQDPDKRPDAMCRNRWKCTQGKIRQQEGKKSIMRAVNKKMIYGVIHLQRKHDILCSNDAKSCYDCILHSVASMEMQRLGRQANPMKCMIGILQDLEHQIRTAYVTLESFMHNDPPIPLQGIFQGNR